MDKIKSVLFVCTGNTCRSVIAEGLLRKRLKELGKDYIEVRSAGVVAFGGIPPTDETIEVMNEEGVDVSGHEAKALTADIIKEADLVLVMEPAHRVAVLNNVPEAAARTYLLREFGVTGTLLRHDKLTVGDPIGMPIAKYRDRLNDIKKEIDRIAGML